MPELPEVETIKRELEKNILGYKILWADVLDAKTIEKRIKAFKNFIKNKKIKSLKRRGKIMFMEFTDNSFLAFHLKISGQLVLKNKKSKLDRFTRVVIHFDHGKILLFNDLRKFGWIKFFKSRKQLEEFIKKFKLGIEPLSREFNFNYFNTQLNNRKNTLIKPFLLNQGIIAGIGNIYALEALYYAKIKPLRRNKTLSRKERKSLHHEIIRVLKLAIAKRGTSVDQYVDAFGKEGKFDTLLKVYNRKGKKCFRCQGGIKMVKINGRGTYFCPKCQK